MHLPGRELPGTPLVVVGEEEATALAPSIFHEEERETLAKVPVEKRRRDRTAGLIAIKAAVARALPRIPPGEVLVRSGPDGAPEAWLAGASPQRIEVGVSVTHGHGLAAAWALERGAPGVDLERIRPRPEGTFRFYLDERERAPLLALVGEARDAGAVVLWALKEAAWKTLRPPRGCGIIDFEVFAKDLSASEGEASVRLRGAALELARDRGARRVVASYRRVGDIVYAWAEARA